MEKELLEEKALKIKLLVLDVDGVMTDGRIIMDDSGRESKAFNVKDGYGLRRLMNAGIEVAIITGRESNVVAQRAKELGIGDVYQNVKDKGLIFQRLLEIKGLKKDETCCMGDDLPDIPMFEYAGLSVAVADAAEEAREAATYVTKNEGGKGAVREVCEFILKSQKAWEKMIIAGN